MHQLYYETHSEPFVHLISINLSSSFSLSLNQSNQNDAFHQDQTSIFSVQVKIILFIFYSLVFFSAFFGNLLVILVIFMSRKMHSVTNYFLANLAFCDLCVSLFCVYQNYALYVTTNWIFGDIMCKLYHFVHSLSYTSSIISMLFISVERYIAIVYPMKARQLLQMRNFLITLAFVWSIAAISCTPRLFMFGMTGSLCMIRKGYTTQVHIFNLIYVIILLIIPAIIMSVLYTRLCCRLYSKHLQVTYISNRTHIRFKRPNVVKSNGERYLCPGLAETSSSSSCVRMSGDCAAIGMHVNTLPTAHNQLNRFNNFSLSAMDVGKATNARTVCCEHNHSEHFGDGHTPNGYSIINSNNNNSINILTAKQIASTSVSTVTTMTTTTTTMPTLTPAARINADQVSNVSDSFRVHVMQNGNKLRSKLKPNEPRIMSVLSARRKVIRLLIIIVVSFLFCHSPYHFRKLIQDWSSEYNAGDESAILFTMATNLLMYSNSSVNPIIYTLMSEKFRTSIIILYHKFLCWK